MCSLSSHDKNLFKSVYCCVGHIVQYYSTATVKRGDTPTATSHSAPKLWRICRYWMNLFHRPRRHLLPHGPDSLSSEEFIYCWPVVVACRRSYFYAASIHHAKKHTPYTSSSYFSEFLNVSSPRFSLKVVSICGIDFLCSFPSSSAGNYFCNLTSAAPTAVSWFGDGGWTFANHSDHC